MIRRWRKPPVKEEEQPRGFDDFELRLGDVMRGERATLGKSLLDVQRELKVKATYIAAIENADPSLFETQGFIAGYVRSYARYLELDPEWAFNRFCEESGFTVAHGMSPDASIKRAALPIAQNKAPKDPFADPNASFVPRGETMLSRIEPGALGSVAVLLALVFGVGYGGWSVLQEIQKVTLAPVEQAPGVTADLSAINVAQANVRNFDDSVGIATPSAEALDRLYRPQALDVPILVPRDGPIASLNPSEVGTLAGSFAQANAEQTGAGQLDALSDQIANAVFSGADSIQVNEAEAAELALVAVRPTWVRVQSADGSIVFEKIMNAGDRYVVPATENPPILRTGNAGGIFFSVDGQAYGPLGASGSVVKNVSLAKALLSSNFEPVDLANNAPVCEMFQVASLADLSCN